MRIFADIASHDTTGVPPGGRIVRTDSPEKLGELVPINGQFVFYAPEGAALDVDQNSFFLPQSNPQSISYRAAAEFLIRYPMYDHALYNFYLDNNDVDSYDIGAGVSFPSAFNTTPAFTPSFSAGLVARCQIGRSAGPGSIGMVPNSAAMLPVSVNRATPVYGSLVTVNVDLWKYNPCYIQITGPIGVASILVGGTALTGVAAARTPGADDFNTVGTPATVALDIVAAINDPTNSFSAFVLAVIDLIDPTIVQLRPIPATNTTVTVSSPSLNIVTVESHPGTEDVMLWWKSSRMVTTQDQGLAVVGANAGENSPTVKYNETLNPDDPELIVFVSVDGGVSWYQANYLEPVDLTSSGVNLKICFVNVGTSKVFIHGFCALFSDLMGPM
jgi:hypothetical protein